MASSDDVPHVQAKFFTRQEQYSVPDHPFSVPATVGIIDLSALINSLLFPDTGTEDGGTVSFDFLIDGEFLRMSLQDHMESHAISTETVVEVEYVEQRPAPEPEDSLVHDDWVSAIRASGDYILTGSYDNTVRVWTTEGDQLITIPGHTGPVKCVAWIKQDDDDSVHQFVTGSHDSTLLVWEWNQQRNAVDCVTTCRGHAGSVDCVAVNPSKTKFCSGSWDRMLKVWSTVPTDAVGAASGEAPQKRKKMENNKEGTRVPLMTLSGHSEDVSAALWTSEEEIITGSWDHSIRTWDVQTGQHKATLMGNKVFMDISYSPLSKTVIAASADRHIRLYDPRSTDGQLVKSTFTSHTGWVSGVAWSPENEHEFISGSYDSLMKLWDTRSPKAPIYDLTGHEGKVLAVDWSVPQYLMSGADDNHLKVFKYSEHSRQNMTKTTEI